MTNHLFWHIASYNPKGEFLSPPYHQIIAVAGIEVNTKDPQSAHAWIAMSKNPAKLVARIDTAVGEAHLITSFTGINYGLPVIFNNALRTGTQIGTIAQKVGDEIIGHIDMDQELRALTNPSGFGSFDLLCELCSLPARPKLDVAASWESDNPKVRKRIGKRLLIDVVLIALGYAHLQYVTEVWDEDVVVGFRHMIIETAAAKVPAVATVFSTEND
jgi:hypothetical protein